VVGDVLKWLIPKKKDEIILNNLSSSTLLEDSKDEENKEQIKGKIYKSYIYIKRLLISL